MINPTGIEPVDRQRGRRAFMVALAGSLFAAPLAAEAQPTGKVYRIGVLGAGSESEYKSKVEAMRQGLRDLGYIDGKNVTIEYRWAEGQYERLPGLAAALLQSKVDIIVTTGTPGSLAAKRATKTIPIVMAAVGNPVESGIVQSISSPGGNITGLAMFMSELNAKRLQLLKESIPTLTRVAVLSNRDNSGHQANVLPLMKDAAESLRITLYPVSVRGPDSLKDAVAEAKARAEGGVVPEDAMFIVHAKQIAEFAVMQRLPTIGFREFVEVGGLAAYAVDLDDMWRRSMVLVDKIFRGAKPGDLPIQQATKFELVINVKTAKALGLTIPPSLLARADQVIE